MNKEILIVEPRYVEFKWGLKVTAPNIVRFVLNELNNRWYPKSYDFFKKEKEPAFEATCNKAFSFISKKVKDLPKFLTSEELKKVLAILKMQNVVFANELGVYARVKAMKGSYFASYAEDEIKRFFVKIM